MADFTSLLEVDTLRLQKFHARHFPKQQIPAIASESSEEDGLGYYEDGVKRTLTDEQVKMFRHSEIQRLLSERRRKAEEQDEHNAGSDEGQDKSGRKAKMRDTTSRKERVPEIVTPTRRIIRTYDEPPAEGADLALDYGDQGVPAAKFNGPKTFLWPKLG